MTRLYGRSKRGQRCVDSAPSGKWRTTSLLGSLRLDGSSACMIVEGATDTHVFLTYVQNILLPTLKKGDWVIADNLSVHKDAQAQELIESVGARFIFFTCLLTRFESFQETKYNLLIIKGFLTHF